MHELDVDLFAQWHLFHEALYIIINMGLYAQADEVGMRVGRSQALLLIMYLVFMMMLQVIILNMLIAVMAESHSRVTSQSELVAQYGRAKLVLEYESAEIERIRGRAKRGVRASS